MTEPTRNEVSMEQQHQAAEGVVKRGRFAWLRDVSA